MTNEKYESPEIQVISIEPDESIMGVGTGSQGVDDIPTEG